MTFEELKTKLSQYKLNYTEQNWMNDECWLYENKYFRYVTTRTSNKSGGKNIEHGKQWSIIVELKCSLAQIKATESFHQLYKLGYFDITPVTKGRYMGMYGIRLYEMSDNPSKDIVKNIMDYFCID